MSKRAARIDASGVLLDLCFLLINLHLSKIDNEIPAYQNVSTEQPIDTRMSVYIFIEAPCLYTKVLNESA